MRAAIGKFIYWCIVPGLALHSLLFKVPRVRVIVINPRGEILLVKTWISHQRWSLPGGGVKRGEDPKVAASRELHEETGLKLDDFEQIGNIRMGEGSLRFKAIIFKAHAGGTDNPVPVRTIEVMGVRWCNPSQLPPHLQKITHQYLG